MRITYIGHATLLIEINGVRILTDPNFDTSLAGILPRVSAPGISLEQLPPIDLVLLTHAHADHLSFASLRELGQIPIYTPPSIARWLRVKGFPNAMDFLPGESFTTLGGITVRASLASHRGNRYAVDRWRSHSNMYLVATNSKSVFFAGDTGLRQDTTKIVEEELHQQGRKLDIALLPIGYAPKWKVGFQRGHLTSQDALTLFERLGARRFIPYHWGTFHHVTSSPFDAITQLRHQMTTHVRGGDVRILEPGESFEDDSEPDTD